MTSSLQRHIDCSFVAFAIPAYANLKPNVDYIIDDQVAQGGFSDVFKGTLKREDLIHGNNGNPIVIIKKLHYIPSQTEEENNHTFYQEVAIMSDMAPIKNCVKVALNVLHNR